MVGQGKAAWPLCLALTLLVGEVWFALDLELPERPSVAPPLSVLLPCFLHAYEVYVDGELVAALGHPPRAGNGGWAWAPFRAVAHPVPEPALADGRLSIRVRSFPEPAPGRWGTYSGMSAETMALGPRETMEARAAELVGRLWTSGRRRYYLVVHGRALRARAALRRRLPPRPEDDLRD